MSKLRDKLMKLLRIRSPSLQSVGYYDCENCTRHIECGCDFCEVEDTVICSRSCELVNRHHTCKHFKRIIIKPLCKKHKRGLRRIAPIIDEWSGSTIIKDKEN